MMKIMHSKLSFTVTQWRVSTFENAIISQSEKSGYFIKF